MFAFEDLQTHQARMTDNADLGTKDLSWRRSPFLYSMAVRMSRRTVQITVAPAGGENLPTAETCGSEAGE
jgi:hypothetical protein